MNVKENHISKKKKEVLNMAVMATPNKRTFVVAKKDAKKFQEERTPREGWNKIMAMAEEFNKNNLKLDDNDARIEP